jgi:hypothetical protein
MKDQSTAAAWGSVGITFSWTKVMHTRLFCKGYDAANSAEKVSIAPVDVRSAVSLIESTRGIKSKPIKRVSVYLAKLHIPKLRRDLFLTYLEFLCKLFKMSAQQLSNVVGHRSYRGKKFLKWLKLSADDGTANCLVPGPGA